MKTNPDPEREETLLNSVLRDEQWQASDTAFKAQAMGAFRTRQRVRRMVRWTGGVVVFGALLASVIHLSKPAPLSQPQLAAARIETPKKLESTRFLTDEELLASFPEGSCFIAEIDGQKELIFLDPELERLYVSKPARPAN